LDSNEDIIEAMIAPKLQSEDMHHRSYFLLEINRFRRGEFWSTMTKGVDESKNPLAKNSVYAKENLTYQKTFQSTSLKPLESWKMFFIGAYYYPKEICRYTSLFKEFCALFPWYYKEMT
jgi:hypothetical protein